MLNPAARVAQRYLVPRFVASGYFYLKYRAVVSLQARVQLTKNVVLGEGVVIKPFVIITTHAGRVSIGRKSAVSSFDHISAGDADITIGDYVRLAPHVTLIGGSRNFRERDKKIIEQGSTDPGLRIGDDVLVGAGSIVLPGCDVGEGAVIGAGSVVTAPVEPYAIVAGAPAKRVGERE